MSAEDILIIELEFTGYAAELTWIWFELLEAIAELTEMAEDDISSSAEELEISNGRLHAPKNTAIRRAEIIHALLFLR